MCLSLCLSVSLSVSLSLSLAKRLGRRIRRARRPNLLHSRLFSFPEWRKRRRTMYSRQPRDSFPFFLTSMTPNLSAFAAGHDNSAHIPTRPLFSSLSSSSFFEKRKREKVSRVLRDSLFCLKRKEKRANFSVCIVLSPKKIKNSSPAK